MAGKVEIDLKEYNDMRDQWIALKAFLEDNSGLLKTYPGYMFYPENKAADLYFNDIKARAGIEADLRQRINLLNDECNLLFIEKGDLITELNKIKKSWVYKVLNIIKQY